MRWTVQGLAGGPRRVNHASVAVGNFIYSFGGKTHFDLKLHAMWFYKERWDFDTSGRS